MAPDSVTRRRPAAVEPSKGRPTSRGSRVWPTSDAARGAATAPATDRSDGAANRCAIRNLKKKTTSNVKGSPICTRAAVRTRAKRLVCGWMLLEVHGVVEEAAAGPLDEVGLEATAGHQTAVAGLADLDGHLRAARLQLERQRQRRAEDPEPADDAQRRRPCNIHQAPFQRPRSSSASSTDSP